MVVLACGGSGGSDGPAGYTEDKGKAVFKKYCVACHGMNGKMQMNGAKDLALSVMTFSERITLVKNGKGAMTPFGGILSEEEIELAAKYSMKFSKQ